VSLVVVVVAGIWFLARLRAGSQSQVRMSTVDELLCPVGGMPIDRAISLETPEGTVYFCCGGCIGRFQSAPAEFEKAAIAQREAIAVSALSEMVTSGPAKAGWKE